MLHKRPSLHIQSAENTLGTIPKRGVVSSNDTIDWTYPGYRPNLGRGDSLRSLKESGSEKKGKKQRQLSTYGVVDYCLLSL